MVLPGPRGAGKCLYWRHPALAHASSRASSLILESRVRLERWSRHVRAALGQEAVAKNNSAICQRAGENPRRPGRGAVTSIFSSPLFLPPLCNNTTTSPHDCLHTYNQMEEKIMMYIGNRFVVFTRNAVMSSSHILFTEEL